MTHMKCPACGQLAVVPIEYGYPAAATWAREESGEVLIGGLAKRDERWGCKRCGQWFVEPGDETTPRKRP